MTLTLNRLPEVPVRDHASRGKLDLILFLLGETIRQLPGILEMAAVRWGADSLQGIIIELSPMKAVNRC